MVGAPSECQLVDVMTPLGMNILDELCVALLECLLAVQGAQEHVGLNLDELRAALTAAQRPAWSAYRAASLLHQGAALEPSWSAAPSRPKAIFARHQSAVGKGARSLAPFDPSPSRFHASLQGDAGVDRVQDIVGARPTCAAQVSKANSRCKNAAIYLGSATFARHCYAHLTEAERRHLQRYQREMARDQHELSKQTNEKIWRATDLVLAEWLGRRSAPCRWLDDGAQTSG